ncbi:MAG TPA: hypothetical protein VFG72_16085 [Marmoricola sp.]|nr:hypothetical protein [Marmoricola sp.]
MAIHSLRSIGATEVGEAEHAYRDASVSGRLGDHSAILHVYDGPYQPIEDAPTVGSYREGNISVSRSLVGKNSEFGFVCGRYAFALRAFNADFTSRSVDPAIGRSLTRQVIEATPQCQPGWLQRSCNLPSMHAHGRIV